MCVYFVYTAVRGVKAVLRACFCIYWLPNAHAVKEWDRLAPILANAGLLTEGGLSALALMCAIHGKNVQLFTAGETPTGHMVAQYRNLANDFGLTPVAQGKVTPNADKGKGNAFAGNGKKPPPADKPAAKKKPVAKKKTAAKKKPRATKST